MATKRQAKIFRDEVLPPVGEAAVEGKNLGGNVTGFLAHDGCLYPSNGRGLMVVGRAVNGYEHSIDPDTFNNSEYCEEYANKLLQMSSPSDGEYCPMRWITDQWGATERYNTRRSAFWRVIKRITMGLEVCNSGDQDWSSHLVWSELYKVSPADEGNPNDKLCKAQLDGCRQLFELEIREYCPEYLLLLTGREWAKDFLDLTDNDPPPNNPMGQYVHSTTLLSFPGCSKIKVVVAKHPQGQSEDNWVKEVLYAFGSM